MIAAGVWAPRGRARPADGGVVVSGRWAYCSGITDAAVFFAGCIVGDGQDAGGARPTPRVIAIPTGELQVLDTWHTLGLRGTGSHDAVADELFVPDARVLSLLDGPVVDRPLYRFPTSATSRSRSAPPRWATRAARSTSSRRSRRTRSGRGRAARSRLRSATHAAVAEAEASLRAARALYYEAIEAAWVAAQEQRAGSGRAPHRPPPGRHAGGEDLRRRRARDVRPRRGTAIYDDSPLQRRFRDAHTATAHFQVNAASRELPGRVLLGQEADTALL